jgi:hypothetical protein
MGAVTPLCGRLLRRTVCAVPVALALALSVGAGSASALLIPTPPSAGPCNTPSSCPPNTGPDVAQWAVMPMMVGNPPNSVTQSPIQNLYDGPVLGETHVYLIYWDPTNAPDDWPISYPLTTKLFLAQFLEDSAADSHTLDNPFTLDGMYYGTGISHAGNTPGTAGGYEMEYDGSYTDQVNAMPPSGCTDQDPTYPTNVCLTDAQIQAQLQSYIASNGLPTGPSNVYLFMTPPDVTTCLDGTSTECSDPPNRSNVSSQDVVGGYCGYHSVIGSGSSEIVYGQVPWPYPNIPNADNYGYAPPQTVIDAVKDCQPDGVQVQPVTPGPIYNAVSLPNGAFSKTIAEPTLPTDGGIEVEFADVLINITSHVLNGIITDPNLNGWFDAGGLESPDKCEATGIDPGADPAAWWIWAGLTPGPLPLVDNVTDPEILNTFNTEFADGDNYYLQAEFDPRHPVGSSAGQCVPAAELTPRFAAPASVDPNQIVGFDPSPTIATMAIQQYQWNFNDGSPAAVITCPTGVVTPVSSPLICNPSVFHAFSTPGTYPVTLTVTDYGGNTATLTQSVKVLGAVPSGGGGGSSGGGSSSGAASGSSAPSTTSTTTTATTTAAPANVPPKISQSIVASSVSKALRSGILVHYSVTERVAGRFQVLLDARTAKKLGIKGPVVKGVTVSGLANPIEVGTALLETTKAGNDGIAIAFSKSVATKLKHTKTLALTVRLVASNIAGQQVVVTTTVKLH